MPIKNFSDQQQLQLMEWETSILGRKLGRIEEIDSLSRVIRGPEILKELEQQAIASEFEVLVARLTPYDPTPLRMLEAFGFFLGDVGVTFEYEFTRYPPIQADPLPFGVTFRDAIIQDLPLLQDMVTGLFLNSYYYSNPPFSKSEADLLHRQWISNCLRKVRSDKFLIAEINKVVIGFITCRFDESATGVIDLVGVLKEHSKRGVGKSLVQEALKFFQDSAAPVVHVRTQVTNLPAINVYTRLGFRLTNVDATLIKGLCC